MKKYFYTNKNHKFTFYTPQIKIVFSKMSYQAYDEYSYIKDENSFMHLYYNVEIFAKKYVYNKDGEEGFRWRSIASKYAFDFPSIIGLKYMLQEYLEDKVPLEDCRLVHYYHCGEIVKDRVAYVHSYGTDECLYDDAYRLERTIVHSNNHEIKREYSLYVGCALDCQGGGASVGVKMDIPESGLRCLYCCITEFIEDGIRKGNEAVREELKTRDYSVDEYDRLIRKEDGKITEIFKKGEKIWSICFYKGDLDSDNFSSEDYNDVILADFAKDSISFYDGYNEQGNEDYNKIEKEDRRLTIPVKNIIHIFVEHKDAIFNMNEEDIANDLRTVFTKEELEEIQNSDIDDMDEKWSEMIIDRYIIFREHPFQKLLEDEHENHREAVKTILKLLKK